MKNNVTQIIAKCIRSRAIGIIFGVLIVTSALLFPSYGFAYTADDFVIQIDTTNSGNTAGDSILISTRNFYTTYDYTVDWGDGATSTHTGDAFYTYASPGQYTIAITPNTPDGFPAIFNNHENGTDARKFIDVIQWGTNQWQDMRSAFQDASFTTITATDIPDLSQVIYMNEMFWFASTLTSINNIENWDVTNVTHMINLFDGTQFNQDLSSWDVSNASVLIGMFSRSNLSAENYSAILTSWAALPVGSGVSFDASAAYCDTAQTARDILTTTYSWIITDGGVTTDCVVEVEETESSPGGSATRVGDRLKNKLSDTNTTSTAAVASQASFFESVRTLIDQITKNEDKLDELTPEESTKLIVMLREIILYLLDLIPGV